MELPEKMRYKDEQSREGGFGDWATPGSFWRDFLFYRVRLPFHVIATGPLLFDSIVVYSPTLVSSAELAWAV